MVRFEFALGEIYTLAPMVSLGIVPEPKVDPVGMTGTEGWKANGLEGKGYVVVSEEMASMLERRIGKYRCRRSPIRPGDVIHRLDTPPTPQRLD